MARHRSLAASALIALAVTCALPGAAGATSTLLSGYGGPGQGNQALIGSSLSGTASGGGSGGSGGSGAAGAGEPVRLEASSAAGAGTAGRAGHAGGTAAGGGRGAASRRQQSDARRAGSAAAAGAAAAARARNVADRGATGTSTAGLSGTDLVLIALGCALLVATALITGRLARRPGGTRGSEAPGG